PVAVATAAIPPYPAPNASAAATRRRPRSSRNGATTENRSLMGSISITTTIYGIVNQVVNPYITLSKVDSLIPGRALSMFAAFGVEQLIGGGPFLIFALFWFFVGLIGWYVSPHVQPQIIEALHALLKQSSPPQPRKLAADLLGALGELMQRYPKALLVVKT